MFLADRTSIETWMLDVEIWTQQEASSRTTDALTFRHPFLRVSTTVA